MKQYIDIQYFKIILLGRSHSHNWLTKLLKIVRFYKFEVKIRMDGYIRFWVLTSCIQTSGPA